MLSIEKDGKARTNSLAVTLELFILMLIGSFFCFLISKIDPLKSSYALILKASEPSFIRDSRLEVLNDRPDVATKIASKIDVLPQPFFPYSKVELGERSSVRRSKHLKFLNSIFEKATSLYKERHYDVFWTVCIRRC